MNCVWDPRKNLRNVRLHGIAFEDAVKIFEGPRTLEKTDDWFDYGETRVYAIDVTNGLEVTVIYTDISETERRIISAWRSERYERKAYWESLG